MIKITPIDQSEGIQCYCKNCGKFTSLLLKYTIDGADKYNKWFSLCEDCSNAFAKLHFLSMENGNTIKYINEDNYIDCDTEKTVQLSYWYKGMRSPKFRTREIVRIKRPAIYSKKTGFFIYNECGGMVNWNTSYKITDRRTIHYDDHRVQHEYLLGKKSVWVKENDIYKMEA